MVKCFLASQVSELKGQLTQVARSSSATSNNILLRSAMMSPSSAPSQYDEKHRSVLKKMEKDRKDAQEVRRNLVCFVNFIWNKQTNAKPLFGHPLNTDTPLLPAVFLVPTHTLLKCRHFNCSQRNGVRGVKLFICSNTILHCTRHSALSPWLGWGWLGWWWGWGRSS